MSDKLDAVIRQQTVFNMAMARLVAEECGTEPREVVTRMIRLGMRYEPKSKMSLDEARSIFVEPSKNYIPPVGSEALVGLSQSGRLQGLANVTGFLATAWGVLFLIVAIILIVYAAKLLVLGQ